MRKREGGHGSSYFSPGGQRITKILPSLFLLTRPGQNCRWKTGDTGYELGDTGADDLNIPA